MNLEMHSLSTPEGPCGVSEQDIASFDLTIPILYYAQRPKDAHAVEIPICSGLLVLQELPAGEVEKGITYVFSHGLSHGSCDPHWSKNTAGRICTFASLPSPLPSPLVLGILTTPMRQLVDLQSGF